MFMSDVKKGHTVTVVDISADLKIKKRLQDMGLTKGVRVKVLGLYADNAYILNVRGSRVVLGKDIAGTILVEGDHCVSCDKKTETGRAGLWKSRSLL